MKLQDSSVCYCLFLTKWYTFDNGLCNIGFCAGKEHDCWNLSVNGLWEELVSDQAICDDQFPLPIFQKTDIIGEKGCFFCEIVDLKSIVFGLLWPFNSQKPVEKTLKIDFALWRSVCEFQIFENARDFSFEFDIDSFSFVSEDDWSFDGVASFYGDALFGETERSVDALADLDNGKALS